MSGEGLDRVGAQVAGHSLVREIDRGGRSAVFEAQPAGGGQPVVVKVLSFASAVDTAALDVARHQVRVARELGDPGLCEVLDIGEAEGTVFVIERLVDGDSLADTIDEARHTNPIALEEVLHFVERACGALHAAHRAGLVHGDLRPSKVLVDDDGLPVVLDLGLAGLLASGEDLNEAPFYRALESLRDSASPDARADVYSLGAILFELLTLRRPFDAPTREALVRVVKGGPVPELRGEGRRLPAELDVVVKTALAPDPERRYQSAAALAADLRAVREHRPIAARARRQPLGAAALLLLVLLTSGVAGLAGFLAGRAPLWTAQEVEEAHRERRRALVADPAGQEEREREALRALLRADPENDLVRVTLAAGLLLHDRAEEALGLLDTAPSAADPSAIARVRAAAHEAAGRPQEAAAARAELGPPGTCVDAYAAGVLALAGYGVGGAEEAVRHLLQAALLTPAPELPVLAALARAVSFAGSGENARLTADALATHFPESAAAWGVVASLREQAGDLLEAVAACEQVLARDTANPEAYSRLVRLHHALGDTQAAEAATSAALGALDDEGVFRVRAASGLALVTAGAWAGGLVELERALEFDPVGFLDLTREVHVAAARALLELGRAGEAIRHLNPVLDAAPGHAEAGALMERALAAPLD